jgi:hypothetical protein
VRLPIPSCEALFAAVLCGCATVPIYPSRPAVGGGALVADPVPSKLLIHISATAEGLRRALEASVPPSGQGSFELRGPRTYQWARGPFSLRFADGRVQVKGELFITAELPLIGAQTVTLQLAVAGEPVITSDWKARLQGARVEVASKDMRLRTAEGFAGLLQRATSELDQYLESFAYDLGPEVAAAYQRVAAPIDLPLGEAKGCAALKITSLEAGPTVLAGGFEKDLAVIVAPSVTLPCAAPALSASPPALSNVATLPSGPFTVTVPVAARYQELAKAMSLAFTDGKLFFSSEYPELFLSDPEVFATAQDQLVLKLRLSGSIRRFLFRAKLDGNLYFAGHPVVVDNELRVPDLEPTVDTSSFLLALKASLSGSSIRDQARQALRLDLGERFQAVRARLSSDFALGSDLGCLRAEVAKIEVAGVYPHGSYLRVYVTVTAQAGVFLPCLQRQAVGPGL